MMVLLQANFITLLITALIFAAFGDPFDDDNDGDILYLAIGASDTLGIGANPLEEGYVFKIRDALEEELEKDVDLFIVALPAQELSTIEEILELVQDFLEITDQEPDIVTIWVGSNDIIAGVEPDDFEEDLVDTLNLLRDETNAFIFIGNIPNLTQLPRFMEDPDDDVTSERIMTFNEIIEEQADAFGILPVVDLFSQPITDELVSDDGFHPSNEWHQKIADLFLEVIFFQLGLSMSAQP